MPVDLGFAEACELWEVDSCHFPSKVGGKPAWLSYSNLPKVSDLLCKNCGKVLVFLAQVYAPLEDKDSNFHRTLFVFICRDPNCCKRNTNINIKVFRSCLPRKNRFYSIEPAPNKKIFDHLEWAKLCNLCGINSDKHCSKCQKTYYCCRDHQVLDWKSGHKEKCNKETDSDRKNKLLFPQFELAIEPEEIDEHKKLNERAIDVENVIGTMQDVPDEELEAHATEDKDKTFTKFKKKVSNYPEQVIRYERGGQPLWIAKQPLPTVPPCETCGGEREFEFQIMPQLLFVLKEEALDWGVIAIYTCKDSCLIDEKYVEEFAFKQDVSLEGEV